MDWEVAVPFDNMQPALNLVSDFVNGLNNKNRELPMPLVGIFVRFSLVEDGGLLSYTGAGGSFVPGTAAVHIEMPIYVPVNMDQSRFIDYLGPYEEINQRLIKEFGARAHWGKNQYWYNDTARSDLFELQNDLDIYADRMDRFNAAIAEFDPKGMFANPQAKTIGIVYPEFTYPETW